MKKRNIQISLEEAKEWYNSGDSFKKELALKAYKKEELIDLNYKAIHRQIICDAGKMLNIRKKAIMYKRLLVVATYLNSIYKEKYYNGCRIYFYINPKDSLHLPKEIEYKSFKITNTMLKNDYTVYFNSVEAATQAIDILGKYINILFD